jgi:hypothetical protein
MPIDPTVIDVDLVRCDAFDASRPDRWPQTGILEYLDGDDVDEILAWTELFQDVELSAVSALTKQLHRVDFPRGHTMFVEGQPGDWLYIIVSGKVKIGRRSPDGRENLLTIMARRTCSANCRSSTRGRARRVQPQSPTYVRCR